MQRYDMISITTILLAEPLHDYEGFQVPAKQTLHTNQLHIVQTWSGYLEDHVVAIPVANGGEGRGAKHM
jgi:hypothetical protein